MRCILVFTVLAVSAFAQPRAEQGEINGAKFRIDIPEKWNGSLVMFCHGYTPVSGSPSLRPDDPFIRRGYAVAQSAYSGTGWAIEEGMQDTEALRLYFVRKYGRPKRTYVTGMSMGGHITTALAERYPDAYDAAMPLCALMPPAYEFFQRRLFDLRAVFDYYFPGALPTPENVPGTYRRSKENAAKLLALLKASPEKADAVRRYMGYHTVEDVAWVTDFMTEVLGQIDSRAGGNPFDNRATLYDGTPDDNALNDNIKRYAADPRAAEYLKNHAGLTGQIRRPMLEVHTTYDQLIPAHTVNEYTVLVQQAGRQDLFAVQYVKRDGHCTFQPEEIGRAMDELAVWAEQGRKPESGPLP